MMCFLHTFRRQAIVLLVVASASANQAGAQFSEVWAPQELQVGQHANLFAHWDGHATLEGFFIVMPPGWTLESALALRHGYRQVPLILEGPDGDTHQYRAMASRPLRGEYELVLHVKTGELPSQATWSLAPGDRVEEAGQLRLAPHEGFRITHQVRNVEPNKTTRNLALRFYDDGPPLLLRQRALPELSVDQAFTVECWIRTTDLDKVVLSTWNGEDDHAYLLELIVDGSGRIRYYRNLARQHVSMASEAPVADGLWHHVALTHDLEARWTRLFVDGVPVDSIYDPMPQSSAAQGDLAVGHRLSHSSKANASLRRYTGLVDELRIWPEARTPKDIRRTMRQQITTRGADMAVLSFEEEAPEYLVAGRAERTERVAGGLAFYLPARNFQGSEGSQGVELSWETQDPHTASFVVERSEDGRAFEVLGEVAGPAQEAISREEQTRFYSFEDEDISAQVLFYRLRQRYADGTERVSGTVKLGLGAGEEQGAALEGNFPNPFNPTTTITYVVREAQRVRVSVWDVSGQRVAVLVDRDHRDGAFQVGFDGSDLPSGTYFIRLQSMNGSVQTHKMTLAK